MATDSLLPKRFNKLLIANRGEIAMRILRARILEAEQEKAAALRADERRSMVGTGDRSERIRTYNFPQSRVTDHRIGLTVYNLDNVLNGEIQEFIDALQFTENAEKLAKQN